MDTRLNGMRKFLPDCRLAWAPEFSGLPSAVCVTPPPPPPLEQMERGRISTWDLHPSLSSVYGQPPGPTGANEEGGRAEHVWQNVSQRCLGSDPTPLLICSIWSK